MSNKSTMLLEHHLKELKLPTFLREYDKLATQCATEGADHPDYLLRLSELELIDRHHRMVDRRIKAARFPTTKSLDTFDFLSMPSRQQGSSSELGFVPLSKAALVHSDEYIERLVTSNLPFDEWTEVFGSERLTGALLDRLTHHVDIHNVIVVGNSGTGKTHIALGLGLAACQRGLSVGFTTAAALARSTS